MFIAADNWHHRWLRVAYHAPRATALARQLTEIAARQHYWDPDHRDAPDETARLDAILDELSDLRDHAVSDRTKPSPAPARR